MEHAYNIYLSSYSMILPRMWKYDNTFYNIAWLVWRSIKCYVVRRCAGLGGNHMSRYHRPTYRQRRPTGVAQYLNTKQRNQQSSELSRIHLKNMVIIMDTLQNLLINKKKVGLIRLPLKGILLKHCCMYYFHVVHSKFILVAQLVRKKNIEGNLYQKYWTPLWMKVDIWCKYWYFNFKAIG